MADRSVVYFPAGEDPVTGSGVTLMGDGTALSEARGGVGRLAPTWNVVFAESPGVAGARWVSARKTQRAYTVRLNVRGANRGILADAMADVIAGLTPEAGPGTLVVAARIGSEYGRVRRISAVYAGGLEGDEVWSWQRATNAQFVLRFLTEDPVWYTLEPVLASWSPRTPEPFFPMVLSSGDAFLSQAGLIPAAVLDIAGDTESWPRWSVTGPFARMRVTNDRSGEWWQVSRGAEDAPDSVVLTSKPGVVSLRTTAGVNVYRQLSGRPFALLAGDSVTVEVDGQSSTTRLDMAVDEAWLTEP